MRALIDGDIVCYRAGAAADGRHYVLLVDGKEVYRCKYKKEADEYVATVEPDAVIVAAKEPEPVENALHNAKTVIEGILDALDTKEYTVYLSPTGSSSFRYQLYSEYKANRKDMEKPFHYSALREYLTDMHGAEVADGIEADDALGIEQFSSNDTVICSIDKDLKMIPGWHYNFVTKELQCISDVDAWFNFHQQLLTGDNTDNVPGLYGIGEVKAARFLGEYLPEDYTDAVAGAYKDRFPDEWEERLNLTAQLLWIQREHGQTLRLKNKETDLGRTFSWGTVDLAQGE